MSNLIQHARRELKLCGQYDEDPAFAQSLTAAVAAFSSYGHSGGSAEAGIAMLAALLRFEPLSPLTDDPDDWMYVAEQDGGSLHQSRRNSQAFSTDEGASYYLLSERDTLGCTNADAPRHTSVVSGRRLPEEEGSEPPCPR